MMETTIYHNPRCRKSREALELLTTNTTHLRIVEYIKEPLTEDDLSKIIRKLDIEPIELVRKNEPIWKDIYRGKILTSQELIKAMIKHPKLMQRPIVVNEKAAVIGRPATKVLEVI